MTHKASILPLFNLNVAKIAKIDVFGGKKKWYNLSKLVGRGLGEVIWTKSKRTAAFFRDVFP